MNSYGEVVESGMGVLILLIVLVAMILFMKTDRFIKWNNACYNNGCDLKELLKGDTKW